MKNKIYHLVCALLALLLIPHCLFASATQDANKQLHYRKYHIRVAITFAADVSITSSLREQILQSVKQTAQRTVGTVWDLQVVENQQLFPVSTVGLNRLDQESYQKSLAQFETSDFLDRALLIKQFAAAEKAHQKLLEKAKKRSGKKARKLTSTEKIWLSLSAELREKILAATHNQSETTSLLPEIQQELNHLLSSTKLIPKSKLLSEGVLVSVNRDRIIAAFPNVFSKLRYDKSLLVTVKSKGAGFQLAGREWDETTRRFSAVQQTTVINRRSLGIGIVQFLTHLFHPHFEIIHVDEDVVTLRMQGGGFPTPDPSATLLRPGDLLHPLLRYMDRRHIVQKVQLISYTYLQVQRVERNRVTCKLISGIRSPLGTGRRRRVESLAIGIKRASASTQLKLMPRKGVQNPLVGYRVTVVTSKKEEKENKIPPVHLISNREGEVTIPTRVNHPILWLFIRSGKALLARVPLVPGYNKQETLPLGDDAIRLRVEGQVAILKGDLIDVIARRVTTMARASAYAQKSDWKKVDELTKVLVALPDIKDFQRRLNRIQILSLEAADKQGDRLAKSRIRNLCNDAGKLIKDFLDNEKVEEFVERMVEERKG